MTRRPPFLTVAVAPIVFSSFARPHETGARPFGHQRPVLEGSDGTPSGNQARTS